MESSVAWSRRTEKCTSKSFLQKSYATFVGEWPWLIFDLAFNPISALGHLGLTSTEKWKNLPIIYQLQIKCVDLILYTTL